jgi:hypothetical protein
LQESAFAERLELKKKGRMKQISNKIKNNNNNNNKTTTTTTAISTTATTTNN